MSEWMNEWIINHRNTCRKYSRLINFLTLCHFLFHELISEFLLPKAILCGHLLFSVPFPPPYPISPFDSKFPFNHTTPLHWFAVLQGKQSGADVTWHPVLNHGHSAYKNFVVFLSFANASGRKDCRQFVITVLIFQISNTFMYCTTFNKHVACSVNWLLYYPVFTSFPLLISLSILFSNPSVIPVEFPKDFPSSRNWRSNFHILCVCVCVCVCIYMYSFFQVTPKKISPSLKHWRAYRKILDRSPP